jgi:hypothetical protein
MILEVFGIWYLVFGGFSNWLFSGFPCFELTALAVSSGGESTRGFWWKIYGSICFFNALA